MLNKYKKTKNININNSSHFYTQIAIMRIAIGDMVLSSFLKLFLPLVTLVGWRGYNAVDKKGRRESRAAVP